MIKHRHKHSHDVYVNKINMKTTKVKLDFKCFSISREIDYNNFDDEETSILKAAYDEACDNSRGGAIKFNGYEIS